ncbi:hypothetical protein [Pseudomonas nitroreducens]|uniref:hypothetical protein n=1 Tax=Pseudomonas nitroreducens TaxID=46680 RepID=UPI00265B4FE3|nr:hypothetical protein [Pseudomonas nitroreducens]MCP1652624.1 hypothetical protein [Pseudomonas nitroreducens]MCP1689199.1 hypothetical protein [Pseudomonas nitroreducens]
MNMSESPRVTLVLGPDLGEALGRSLGETLKDSLGLAVADALLRLESARAGRATERAGGAPPSLDLHQSWRDGAQSGNELAQQTLGALREIATLLRQPGTIAARPAAGPLGSTAIALPSVAYEWSKKESAIPEAFSGTREAAVFGLRNALQYEQRIQEIAVRGGLVPGKASETLVAKQVEAAARGSGVDSSAALDMVRVMMNAGLTLERSLQYLPAATKLQYGKALTTEAVVGLVTNIQQQGNGDAAEVERGLGVISWRARQEGVSVEQLVRRLDAGQDVRSWRQVLQRPEQMLVDPSAELQSSVDARRNTVQGQRNAAENALGGTLQAGGSVILRTMDAGLPAVTGVATGLTRAASLDGARMALATLQFGLAQDMVADFAAGLGYERQAQGIRSLDLGPLRSPGALIDYFRERLTGEKPSPSASATGRLPSLGQALSQTLQQQTLVQISPVSPKESLLERWRAVGEAVGAPADSPTAAPSVGSVVGGGMLAALMFSPVGSLIGATLGILASQDAGDNGAAAKSGTSRDAEQTPVQTATRAPGSVSGALAPGQAQNWTFSPQISINVAGNVSDPGQLANELLPRLQRMLADFSLERRRDALFDMAVV